MGQREDWRAQFVITSREVLLRIGIRKLLGRTPLWNGGGMAGYESRDMLEERSYRAY
jgi:hypothetical protein